KRLLLTGRNGITTTVRAPTRAALFGFRTTVKAYPGLPSDTEIHRQAAATCDRPSAAILNCRDPTSLFVTANITSSLGSEQDRVLRYSRLAVVCIHGLRCCRLSRSSRCGGCGS